jgi:hypothetical protein
MVKASKVEEEIIKVSGGKKYITEDVMNKIRKIKGIFVSYLGYSKLENCNRYMLYDKEQDLDLWEVFEKC